MQDIREEIRMHNGARPIRNSFFLMEKVYTFEYRVIGSTLFMIEAPCANWISMELPIRI